MIPFRGGVPPQLASVMFVVPLEYPPVHEHACEPPGSTTELPNEILFGSIIQMPVACPPAQPKPMVGMMVVDFGPAPRSTTLFWRMGIDVTYHVPAGMLTTLCVASQEASAFWIAVALAAAALELLAV